MADQKSSEPIEVTVGKTTANCDPDAEIHGRGDGRPDEDRHPTSSTRRPLEADLVNPLPENFHREAHSVPLAHAAVLMAEYRSANINGALISPQPVGRSMP